MSTVNLTAAAFKLSAVLLVFAISSKGVRGQDSEFQCQTLAFELYAFAKPSDSLDCKQACDKRFKDLCKMPKAPFEGVNLLSSRSGKSKNRATAKGIFWIDQCVVWLRYCFKQRAAMLTVEKDVPDSQKLASKGPALTCLCRSVFLLMQARKDNPLNPQFCEQEKICERLTERLSEERHGLWACKKSIHVRKASCSTAMPICPCCVKRQEQHPPPPCRDWPEIDKLMNEAFVLGDQEWLPYDLHGAPQPEEGFPQATVLEPQGPACPVEQEGPSRFRTASLPFRTFGDSACGQAGSCAAVSSGASQMHSHFEGISEAREYTFQLQDCVRPPQKQGKKRKAAVTADASCSISARAPIGQSQSDLTTRGSQFSEAYPFSFTTMNDGELFFGSQFVSAQTTGGQGHSMASGASGIDPDNLQFSQVFAESSDIDAEHATVAVEPDNLQFSDYYGAAGSIPLAGSSNSDDSAKETQDSLNAFDGIP